MAGKKTKWFVIIFLISTIIIGLWIAAFVFAGASLGGSGGTDFESKFEEIVVEEGDSSDKVAMVNVIGEIFSDPADELTGASDTNLITQLEQVIQDPDVVGVILNLETPGGGVVASDNVYRKVLEVKKEEIPVVALMNDVAASGGYYIAAGADEIVAHPSTFTGSIGVIMMLPNLQGAADKVGVGVDIIKSGALKDAGSPFRDVTPEERQVFQTLIDQSYGQFVKAVANGRDMSEEQVRGLADGRIYSGVQAKENGLVDLTGDRDDAFERAKALADSPDATLVRYGSRAGLGDLFNLGVKSLDPEQILEKSLGIRRQPGVAYLWLP